MKRGRQQNDSLADGYLIIRSGDPAALFTSAAGCQCFSYRFEWLAVVDAAACQQATVCSPHPTAENKARERGRNDHQ